MFEFHETERELLADRYARLLSGVGKIGKSALIISLLLGCGAAEAKIVYVNSAVASSGNGTSWATAFRYLRDALHHSTLADTIYLAKGTYYPDEGVSGRFGDREFSFDLKGQKIYGGFAGTETSITQRNPQNNTTILSGAIWDGEGEDAYWSLHVVILNQSSTLDGVIVENGHASGADSWNYPRISFYDEGGGCFVKAGKTLTLNGCTFRGNRALSFGGAIMVADATGKVVATNCEFDSNEITLGYGITTSLPEGGAIKGNVQATNCRFISNKVTSTNFIDGTFSKAFGGAISGNVTATNCEFTGNEVLSYGGEGVKAEAAGGAISGNVSATKCKFFANQSRTEADQDFGNATGGAISGGSVAAVNCSFSENASGKGKIEEDGTGSGGGGAVYVSKGKSTLANCVFVGNTSEVRGGAIHGGTSGLGESLVVANCTFLNNGVATGSEGAALSCGGVVRILNNVFSHTADTVGAFDQDNLIHVVYKGALRNSDVNYPTPSTVAPNLVKGGESAITRDNAADIFLAAPTSMVVDADPMFANAADPDGADNVWGTVDDGLRPVSGSPAIGVSRDSRIPGSVNLLPKDIVDVDRDGDFTEALPIDYVGVVRVQNSFVELGAYELGALQNVPEISVFLVANVQLVDGGSNSYGSVALNFTSSKTFTIKNVGVNTLQNISVSITGGKAFFVKSVPAKSLKPGASTTVTVNFKPTAKGKQSARLMIASDDANESPFDISLSGTGIVKKKVRKSPDFAALASSTFSPAPSYDQPSSAVITTTTAADGSKYLILTVRKPAEGSFGKPTVEVSSNLLDWYSGDHHTTTLVNSSSILSVRDNTPVNRGEKRFIRLK